jgi:hypothetical protein
LCTTGGMTEGLVVAALSALSLRLLGAHFITF